jgi:transposase InsO family protein
MEKLFIDYVGPLPRSKSGNSFLLVCVDAFSKFVWLLPLRQANARLTIIALQNQIFQHFGIPSNLVSDNGPQFMSAEFRRMCFAHGIRHVTTSPYYPQPSHAERFNRNLRSALIAYHANQQNCWDQNLRWLQLAFNTALHESHKAVPFEVLFGFSPVLPLANLWRIEDLLPNSPDRTTGGRWREARKNLLRAHESVRVRYNKGRVPNPFKVGDWVYCQSHPVSSAVDRRSAKLCFRWSGPHRILDLLSPVTVKLSDPGGGVGVVRAHISKLKPCHQGGFF